MVITTLLKSSRRFINLQPQSCVKTTSESFPSSAKLLLARDRLSSCTSDGNKCLNPADASSGRDKLINPFDLSINTASLSSYTEIHNPLDHFSNLKMTIPTDLSTHLQSIVSSFDNLSSCFGYGSGVFPQASNSNHQNQIDLLMSVENPLEWHKQNIKKFPQHYSTLKYFINIPSIFEKIQGLGAGIYFNPFTQINGSEVKYGLMSNKTLLSDLRSWNTFYTAGRLQKPVVNLKTEASNVDYSSFDLELGYWLERNLIAAAVIAKKRSVVKYGTQFTDFQFFTELCTLSYLGDIRFKLGGENPSKCANIVSKNLSNFKLLYGDILNEVMLMEDSEAEKYLPLGFSLQNYEPKLEKIIAEKSLEQAVKGVFTAGIWKSCKYAWAKKMKALKN